MIHWSWTITTFVAGIVCYGIMDLIAELKDRQKVAEIYRQEYLKQNDSKAVSAEDFEQELELHKN